MTAAAITLVDEARHLPKGLDARVRAVIVRALRDVAAVVEEPPGSNRGAIVDDYNRRAGVPVASFWCASAVGAWWRDAGLAVPTGYASCDNWLAWARKTGRFTQRPTLGAAVLYGKPTDANHIGLVVRVAPIVLSVEGNTTVEGAAADLTRNGTAVSLKVVNAADPVLGYVLPFAPAAKP